MQKTGKNEVRVSNEGSRLPYYPNQNEYCIDREVDKKGKVLDTFLDTLSLDSIPIYNNPFLIRIVTNEKQVSSSSSSSSTKPPPPVYKCYNIIDLYEWTHVLDKKTDPYYLGSFNQENLDKIQERFDKALLDLQTDKDLRDKNPDLMEKIAEFQQRVLKKSARTPTWSEVETAIKSNNVAKVEEFVKYSNMTSNLLSSALVTSAIIGNLPIINILLNNGADIDAFSGRPLVESINNHHEEVTKRLIENGANVNLALIFGLKYFNYPPMVKELVEHRGADVNYNMNEPLKIAIAKAENAVLAVLLEFNAETKNNNFDAFQYAFSRAEEKADEGKLERIKVIKQLLGAEIRRNAPTIGKIPGLEKMYIQLRQQMDNVEYDNLQRNTRKVDAQVYNELIKKAREVYTRLQKEINIAPQGYNLNVLKEAIRIHNVPIVQAQLALIPNIHKNEDEILFWALSHGSLDVISMILDKGANIHARHDQAIVDAVKTAYRVDLVDLLLNRGADINVNNGAPLKALVDHFNNDKIHIDMLNHIIQKGANISINNEAALKAAVAKNRNTFLIRKLLENGANFQAHREEILRLAKTNRIPSIYNYLLNL